jgi:norsolorinic acid ketoreductase
VATLINRPVSGANRGIGHGLATLLAARPNTIIFAGARDPAAQSLKDLSAKYPNVHPIKLTSGDQANNEAVASKIQSTAGQLDVVIANAGKLTTAFLNYTNSKCIPGIANHYGPVATTPASQFRDHWEVNTLGPVVLFQAVHTLLLASPSGAPIFAVISTGLASMTKYIHLSAGAYGSSKAAINFLVKVLDTEHPSLISLAINPGWVATELGNAAASTKGMPQAPVSLDDSLAGILARLDGATKEKSSGRFLTFRSATGNPSDVEIPW